MDFGLLPWTGYDSWLQPDHSLTLRLLKYVFDNVLLEQGGLP